MDRLLHRLSGIRDSLVAESGNGMDPIGKPQQLLAEYESNRHGAELGRLFQRASAIHKRVDRVVVLGLNPYCTGAKAILSSCCQPFWNELSRADRGSKPRMYFDGNNLDNDATQSLLHLLDTHKPPTKKSEQDRWALVVINQETLDLETRAAFDLYLHALQESCAVDDCSLDEILIPVLGADSKFHPLVQQLGNTDSFPIPKHFSPIGSILCAPGLVLAAMLGVNVIELLQGAVAMTEHFATAKPEDNTVLRFVATHLLLSQQSNSAVRETRLWSTALEDFGHWYDDLVYEVLGGQSNPVDSRSTVDPRDLHSRTVRNDPAGGVVNNIISLEHRFDALRVGGVEDTYAMAMTNAIDEAKSRWKQLGRPVTSLLMPRVDELHMGQLFQMMLLATKLESLI